MLESFKYAFLYYLSRVQYLLEGYFLFNLLGHLLVYLLPFKLPYIYRFLLMFQNGFILVVFAIIDFLFSRGFLKFMLFFLDRLYFRFGLLNLVKFKYLIKII
jgi:hypothetical protein